MLVAQGACPCCFRHPRKFIRTPPSDPRVDPVQAHCARRNPLRVIDLQSTSNPCDSFDKTCCIRCLVCGVSVIDWGEHNFSKARRIITKGAGHAETWGDIAADLLVNNFAVITRRWRTPVHYGCTYVAKCKCRLPLGEWECSKHVTAGRLDIQVS